MMQSPIVPLAILLIILGTVLYLTGKKKGRIKSTSTSTDRLTDKKPVTHSRWDKMKGLVPASVGLGKVLVLLIIAVLVGGWLWEENDPFRPDTIGSGQTLLDGDTITIKKHYGNDYSELPKYETVAEGYPTRLMTGGEQEVYVLVWKRNGEDELVPDTRGPEAYTRNALSRCSVETFSIFLGPKSGTDKLKNVVAHVDTTRRCSSIDD